MTITTTDRSTISKLLGFIGSHHDAEVLATRALASKLRSANRNQCAHAIYIYR